jgi:predicted site-specific integrase-resolvase
MTTRHLNQIDLANRWCMSERTLERWRYEGRGPAFLKIGGRVLYRLKDVEGYEMANQQLMATSNPISAKGHTK